MEVREGRFASTRPHSRCHRGEEDRARGGAWTGQDSVQGSLFRDRMGACPQAVVGK